MTTNEYYREDNNLSSILLVHHKTKSLSSTEPTEGARKSVHAKPPTRNRFIELDLDDSLQSLGYRTINGAVDGLIDRGNGWANFRKITNPANTYHCSTLIPSTNITLEDMYRYLGVVLSVKAKDESIEEI